MIEKDGGTYRLSGSALIADARGLLDAGRALLLAETDKEIAVDLAAVSDVDSSALGVFFGLMRTAKERGVALRLINPPASLVSLAGLYGVSDSLPLT